MKRKSNISKKKKMILSKNKLAFKLAIDGKNKMKSFEQILKRSIQIRIRSFELRNEAAVIFKNSNDISIQSLKAKLSGDLSKSDILWKKAIDLKEKAKLFNDKCQELQERSSYLENVFHELINEFKE